MDYYVISHVVLTIDNAVLLRSRRTLILSCDCFLIFFSSEKDDRQNQKLFVSVTSNMFHFSLLPLLINRSF